MSELIQSTNTTATITVSGGDTQVVLAGVNVDVVNADAISGAASNITIFDEGALFGAEGIFIDGATNIVSVSASGSITAQLSGMDIANGHDTVLNDGDIIAGTSGIFIQAGNLSGSGGTALQGSSFVTNSGTIDSLGGNGTAGILLEGDDNRIANTGAVIGAYDGIYISPDNSGHAQSLTNSGTISGTHFGIHVDGAATETIVNTGEIDGGIALGGGSSSVIRNAGTLNGDINFLSGNDLTVSNTGTMFGTVEFGNGNMDTYINTGEVTGGVFCQGNSNTITNKGDIFAGAGFGIYVTNGGNVITNTGTISGDEGISVNTNAVDSANTIFNSGLIASTAHSLAIDGGNESMTIVNDGVIHGNVNFGVGSTYDGSLGSVTGVVNGFNGNDLLIGGAGVDRLDGGSGQDVIDGNGGNDFLSVDNDPISPSTDTAEINGGDGNDSIVMNAMFNANDEIDGGSGRDTLFLTGNYSAGVVLGADTLTNVEKIVLAGVASYKLTTNDNTVAAGATLTVDGSALTGSNTLNFNGAAETDGRFVLTGGTNNDVLTGGAGNDVLTGNAGNNLFTGGMGADHIVSAGGHDHFIYNDVSESTGLAHDVITGFSALEGKFDLDVTVTGIDSEVTSGRLSAANFDANLATAIGSAQLAAGHAVLFTPTVGNLAGHTLLIVDANGVAGYQAGQDYVFDLVGAAHLNSLATTDFI